MKIVLTIKIFDPKFLLTFAGHRSIIVLAEFGETRSTGGTVTGAVRSGTVISLSCETYSSESREDSENFHFRVF